MCLLKGQLNATGRNGTSPWSPLIAQPSLQTCWTLNWLCPPNPSGERCLAHSNVICVSLCRSPINFPQTEVCHAVMQMLPNVSQKKKNAMPSLHQRKAHSLLSQFRYGTRTAMLALYDLSCVANLLWPGYGACRLYQPWRGASVWIRWPQGWVIGAFLVMIESYDSWRHHSLVFLLECLKRKIPAFTCGCWFVTHSARGSASLGHSHSPEWSQIKSS